MIRHKMNFTMRMYMCRLLCLTWISTLALACGGAAERQEDQPADGDPTDSLCSPYASDSAGHLEVYIRNDRTTPIFLGSRVFSCGTPPSFSLANEEATDLYPFPFSCGTTCDQLMSGQTGGCLDICIEPETIRIEPGGAHHVIWDTLLSNTVELPVECDETPSEYRFCEQRKRIEPGTVTFRAEAGTELSCGEGVCADCSSMQKECVGRPLVAGEELAAETTVTLDASYGIYAAGETAEAPPGVNVGALNNIEISFKD